MIDLTEHKQRLQEILDKSKTAAIGISAPDGDSIGSALALKLILEQLDKKVDIISSFDLGGRFNSYPGSSQIIIADLGRTDFTRYDVLFTVDAGQKHRLVKSELYPTGFNFPKSLEIVNIDHHASNDLFGTLNVNIINASCTAEIIDKLFDGQYYMDSTIATLMYFSIIYDTANFRWNISENLFELAKTLLSKDANIELVFSDYFNNRSLIQTKYEATLLSRMVEKKNFVYTLAYHDDIEKYEIDVAKFLNATATIARDYLSSFKEADFGFVISERKNDVIKVEMRAKHEDTPILEIAESLGGGGHIKACGAKVSNKSVEEVLDFILKYLE